MTAIEPSRTETSFQPGDAKNAHPTIVVATDGSEASSAAFKAASLIAEINDVDVRVISVLEPLPVPATVPHALLDFEGLNSSRSREFAGRIRLQIEEHAPRSDAWVVEARTGLPAAEIAESAQEHGAELVIVGASRHGFLARLIGEETAAHVAQLGNIPLLVAAPGVQRLPHRVAIAMDLDPSQLGDFGPVLSMFGPTASVTCVHVQRREDFPGSDSPTFARAYESAVTESFAVIQKALSKASGMRPDLIRLRGDAAAELLRYVEHAKIDLLVLGLRRHYGLRRLMGGGVALNVLRGASCSVLIVPETADSGATNDVAVKGAKTETLTAYDAAMWPSQLKQFTQRNSGRRATLEVDGPALGAFVQVVELPFIGADYDRRDGRVEMLLGDFVGSDRHFARSIPRPDSISVRRGPDLKDDVLCVRYEGGQTLLTFKS